MNQQNSNTSEVRADQAASKKHQTIKLGLDVHADSIVVVRILDHSAPQPAQRFTWGKFREWIKSQISLAYAVHSCCQAEMISNPPVLLELIFVPSDWKDFPGDH